MEKTENSNNNAATNKPVAEDTNTPAPLSLLDKIKLMIIRIGDEKWEMRNEHVKKLEAQFANPFVTKDQGNRQIVKETFIQCIMSMPHKVNIYSYLLGLLASDDYHFANEIVNSLLDSLQKVFVQVADENKTKNIMRLLGNLVNYGLISSTWFCQFLLSILEETFQKNQGSNSCKLHSNDLVFEAILASLPAASTKLQKEQSIDFGTVIESLKTMYKHREQTRKLFAPIEHECASDLLSRMWDAYISNQGKVFNSDKVLLSPSKALVEELISKNLTPFNDLKVLQFADFRETEDSLESRLDQQNRPERLRKYRSNMVLADEMTQQLISDKFELVLALDIANSMIITFQESQSMAAQNLINMYLEEDIRDALPNIILNVILSSLLDLNKRTPNSKKPVFYAVLLNSVINQSEKVESFKKFKEQIEDILSKLLFKNLGSFQTETINRLAQFTSFLITQQHKLDLKQVEPLLLKFLENKDNNDLNESQSAFMNKLFDQLCRLCFQKKVKEQVDDQFHEFFPDDSVKGTAMNPNFKFCATHGGDNETSPDIQIIVDSLSAKMPSDRQKCSMLLDMINGSQTQGTTQLEASKEEAQQMFLEVFLWRTSKSLEHLKNFIERYLTVFQALLQDEQSQIALVNQITKIWSNSHIKVLNTLDKLSQLNVVSAQAQLKWAIESLKAKVNAKESLGGHYQTIEFAVIRDVLMRQSSQREQIIVQYRQNPPVEEDQVITKSEENKAEDAEMEVDQEGNNNKPDALKKPKVTLVQYKEMYQSALNNEIALFTSTIDTLNTISNQEDIPTIFKQSLMALVRDSQTAFISCQSDSLNKIRQTMLAE